MVVNQEPLLLKTLESELKMAKLISIMLDYGHLKLEPIFEKGLG